MADEVDAPNTEVIETDSQRLTRENAELKAALASSNTALEAVSREKTDAQRGQMTESQRRIQAELSGCKGQIESLSTEADGIEAEIARLSDEPGHGAEISKLTRRMAQVEAESRELQGRERYLTNQFERAKTEAAAPTGKVMANGQPLTAFDPAAQAWLEAHPRSFTDRAYFNRIVAAAQAATNLEGLTQNSPEFFAYVEEKAEGRAAAPRRRTEQIEEDDSPLSDTAPATGDDLYAVKKPQAPAAGRGSMASVAAPSRTVPGNTQAGGRRVPALTAEQKSVADDLYGELAPIDRYKKYAANIAYMAERPRSHFNN